MKIRFQNFRRLGAGFQWRDPIPKELARKPKTLVVWEFIQFLIGLSLTFIILFNLTGLLRYGFLVVPAMYLIAAYLLATNDYLYRACSSIASTFYFLLLWFVFREQLFSLRGIITLSIPFGFMLLMYLNPKCKAYYAWCKSVNT